MQIFCISKNPFYFKKHCALLILPVLLRSYLYRMSSYTFTSDDLSLGLDPAYTPILQQNQTTNEERTLRWLDESTMLAFSENNSYFSMTAAVLGEFMAPQMVPSNSTSTISTTGTSSTDFPSIDDNYSIEKQQYQGPDAATPATMYTAEYEFMNDQSLFPPLYDNNNLNNITNDNSDIAAADTIIIPQVLSVSYSQDIVSPTSQFLDENNPSPHQGMNIQALPGPGENCQKQFAYPISMAPIYQGFSSADQVLPYRCVFCFIIHRSQIIKSCMCFIIYYYYCYVTLTIMRTYLFLVGLFCRGLSLQIKMATC